MKHYHFFSRKNRWHAWRPEHPEQQSGEPEIDRTALPEGNLSEGSSPSEALQQWLKAGGKPGDASGYNVEIFVGLA